MYIHIYMSTLSPNHYGLRSLIPSCHVYDCKTGKHVTRPSYQVIIDGFPCTDVSRNNANSSDNRTTISDGSLRTGAVFGQIVDMCVDRDEEVEWGLHENVFAIQDAPKPENVGLALQFENVGLSNLDWIGHKMNEEAKCFFKAFGLQPSECFNSDISRLRLWMPWIKFRLLGDVPHDEIHSIMQDWVPIGIGF